MARLAIPQWRCLAEDGAYRSQCETATGNGSLSAHRGASAGTGRHDYSVAPATLPPPPSARRSALNFRQRATGAVPRFGSAHLRLRPEVASRCTFCYPDASFDPTAPHGRSALPSGCPVRVASQTSSPFLHAPGCTACVRTSVHAYRTASTRDRSAASSMASSTRRAPCRS